MLGLVLVSSWGARLTWPTQREHAAQIIRVVEGHNSVDAFISSLQGRGAGNTVSGGRVGGQRDLRPNYRTGWTALGMAGILDGVDVPHGPAVQTMYSVPFLTGPYCVMRVF